MASHRSNASACLTKTNFVQDVLDQRGITPGGSYPMSDIQEAVVDAFGGKAFLHCQGRNILVEVRCNKSTKQWSRKNVSNGSDRGSEIFLSLCLLAEVTGQWWANATHTHNPRALWLFQKDLQSASIGTQLLSFADIYMLQPEVGEGVLLKGRCLQRGRTCQICFGRTNEQRCMRTWRDFADSLAILGQQEVWHIDAALPKSAWLWFGSWDANYLAFQHWVRMTDSCSAHWLGASNNDQICIRLLQACLFSVDLIYNIFWGGILSRIWNLMPEGGVHFRYLRLCKLLYCSLQLWATWSAPCITLLHFACNRWAFKASLWHWFSSFVYVWVLEGLPMCMTMYCCIWRSCKPSIDAKQAMWRLIYIGPQMSKCEKCKRPGSSTPTRTGGLL